jgi:F-type H+-transporting ATPase subunit gamma
MSSLKELRGRIKSIRSTQKITAAMKMVAASRLRKSQEKAETIRPYSHKLSRMIGNILSQDIQLESPSILQVGGEGSHLVLVMSAARGLCGSYNSLIMKETKRFVKELQDTNQPFCVAVIGHKGFDLLSRYYQEQFLYLKKEELTLKEGPTYKWAERIAEQILHWLQSGKVGKVTVITGHFKSALVHEVCPTSLVPLQDLVEHQDHMSFPYILMEPEPEELLSGLLRKNLCIQIYRMMLENIACEQASRMAAMESATRNAQQMIQKLQLSYNQTRQAHITNELIEIVSGAEAS